MVVMAVSGMPMIIMTVGRGRGMPMVVMTVSSGGSRVTMVVMAVSGVVAMACIMAMVVVRLVLVAHSDSVPQPLSAVFAAKSV
jgi:hypothetical protein